MTKKSKVALVSTELAIKVGVPMTYAMVSEKWNLFTENGTSLSFFGMIVAFMIFRPQLKTLDQNISGTEKGFYYDYAKGMSVLAIVALIVTMAATFAGDISNILFVMLASNGTGGMVTVMRKRHELKVSEIKEP